MLLALAGAFIWIVLARTTLASPPTKRRSNEWNDKYIKEPTQFKVTEIDKCKYQLTFHRDYVDSRYTYSFEAVYGTKRKSVVISPVEGGLPISRTSEIFTTYSPTGRYTIDNGFVLSVHQFNNACRNGEPPRAFRVRANLGCCYTYDNDYRTRPISVGGGSVPSVPRNVQVLQYQGGYQVKWDAVKGATGYFALANGTYPNSEVGDVDVINTVRTGPNDRTAKFNNRTRSVSVVARGANGIVSRTDIVPEVQV